MICDDFEKNDVELFVVTTQAESRKADGGK